jgi:hypothetical protein
MKHFLYEVLGDTRTATPPDVEKVVGMIKRYGGMKAYPAGADNVIEVPGMLGDYVMGKIRGVWQDARPV